MISYERAGLTWDFSPLPVSLNTAKLFGAMASLAKKDQNVDMSAVADLIGALPEAIGRSMRAHHTEDEINKFIDTILLDFGNPDSLSVLADLNMLFMGISPNAKPSS